MIEYLFSINTGRSGSKYVARLFDYVEGCKAQHEAVPIMNDPFMRKCLKGATPASNRFCREAMEEKWQSIQAFKGDAPLYVETSHTFIKGFGWIPNYYGSSQHHSMAI